MATEPAPGAHPEQSLPSYLRRSERWSLVEYGRGVCSCRFLEQTLEDKSLFGGVVWSCARCVDCGAVWESKA